MFPISTIGRSDRIRPDRLVLLGSTASPYSRMARIALFEKGLAHDWREVASPRRRRVQEKWTTVWEPNEAWSAVAANPLGKIPVLFHEGRAWHDSRVICAYADWLSPGPSLYAQPQSTQARAGPSLFIMRVEACCHGICDAVAFSKGIRLRGPESRADAVETETRRTIFATLRELERLLEGECSRCPRASVTMAEIALGVALDYIDFRMRGIGWRKDFPTLNGHYARLASREAFASTRLNLQGVS